MNFLDLFPTIDLFILFLFVVVIVLHLVFVKKSKLLVCLLSVYTSFVLLVIVPLFSSQVLVWLQSHPYMRAIAFVGLIVLLYVLLSFSNLAEFSKKITPTGFATSLVYRIAITGLSFSTILYFLPDSLTANFGVLTNLLFLNLIALAIWFAIPLLLAFAYKFKTRRGWIE
ncbi:MAG: hypothetical protein HOA57_04260 [Candidatus Magasanikbacteria bacterium]|jgi:hypothetical protein|nr:hypothetical protein [Candidatus Magasanikbacteria bacterium]MBT4314983.1 hypothetical protein [Candidatus Magasanikbacteria bacterium]MBT4546939.1 hypothetical protein [Candidatus Magasanikbacteria bacterium]MBT6819561.1 hypothetical protein [Candidatus Magasanikbacteria bacterium]